MVCDLAMPLRHCLSAQDCRRGETERVENARRELSYSWEAGRANVSGTANAPAGRLRSRGFMIPHSLPSIEMATIHPSHLCIRLMTLLARSSREIAIRVSRINDEFLAVCEIVSP